MTALSQEEILQSTRTVVQGLEALKDEHESIKVSIGCLSEMLKEARNEASSRILTDFILIYSTKYCSLK